MYHTGQDKEDEPVHDKDGPEDGDVEDVEPAADERNDDGSSCLVPELELGEAADEWPEFFVLLGRQTARGPVFHFIVENVVGGVKLGLQEGEKQVEQIDAERIGHCACRY